MVNQEYFECSLWNIRNGKRASEECCHVPESFDPVSGSDEFCKKCLCESLEWLNQEYKDSKDILTDYEKEIVKAMIDFTQKCGGDVVYIRKHEDEFNGVYVYCELINKKNDSSGCIYTPWLSKNLFKGLKNRKEYTLEELGL